MILELQNLSVCLRERVIFDGVSLSLRHAEYLALTGANGSGKTTLLRAIIRSLVPSAGQIFLEGRKSKELSQSEIGKMLSYVPQTLHLAFELEVQQFFAEQLDQHADLIVRDLQVDHLFSRRFVSLSGGERQRVLLASALARRPKLLLLDELTQYADFKTTKFLGEYLQNYRRQHALSALIVSHDRDWIKQFADSTIELVGKSQQPSVADLGMSISEGSVIK